MSPTCALAFGDLDGGVWGAAWSVSAGEAWNDPAGDPRSDPPGEPLTVDLPLSVAVRAGTDAEVLAARLAGGPPDRPWRVYGDSVELVLIPHTQPSPHTQPTGEARSGALEGFDQLCQVSGRATLGGSELEVDAPGWLGAWDGRLELERIESFRQVAAWFGREDGLALLALRPSGARGQDADLIAASVLDLKPLPAIDDPRLSTTYGATGVPTRAGVELWFAERRAEDLGGRDKHSGGGGRDSGREAEDPGGEGEHGALPRRAAGEAAAPGLEWEAAGFALQAVPLRWRSRGEDGAGVYLLGRRP